MEPMEGSRFNARAERWGRVTEPRPTHACLTKGCVYSQKKTPSPAWTPVFIRCQRTLLTEVVQVFTVIPRQIRNKTSIALPSITQRCVYTLETEALGVRRREEELQVERSAPTCTLSHEILSDFMMSESSVPLLNDV